MLQERDSGEIDFAFKPSSVKRRYEELRGFGFNGFESYCRTFDLARRDLTFYFLEQFAKKKLVGFEYRFEEKTDGPVNMVSTHYEEFGDVCCMFARARDQRRDAGLDFSREEAELEGVQKVKKNLLEGQQDAAVLLVSRPPDDKSDRPGFGDYSFVYFGKYDHQSKSLQMYAWRNNMSLEEQNQLYSDFSGEEAEPMWDANDFLRSPAIKFGEEVAKVHDELISKSGEVAADFYEYRQEVDRATKVLVDLAASGASHKLMNIAQANLELDFVEAIAGTRDVKFEKLPRIESFRSDAEAYVYVAARRKELGSKFDLDSFSGGGCGRAIFASLGAGTMDGTLVPGMAIPDLLNGTGREFSSYFTCPKCDGKIESGCGTTTCPHCGFTKEQAAIEMGIAC